MAHPRAVDTEEIVDGWCVKESLSGKYRIFHLHEDEHGWKVFRVALNGRCITCNEEAPKVVRFMAIARGLSDD